MDFDKNNVLFRLAVISDIHISYGYHSEQDIVNNLNFYANKVADLYYVSGGKLDAVMICGDYTSNGTFEQARTFVQGTKTIFEGIFGKENFPKVLIGMGNHDTCWRQCMNPKEWFKVIADYGMTEYFESDSDIDEGNIHMTVERDGKKHHFLYAETLNYAPNILKDTTTEWLDNMLSKLTKENPDQYVYVGMHGPVMEAGCYGSDIELDAGANWANSKDTIHHTLKKYPQVVLFTGHNHYAGYLDTTIMQRQYTALNVAALLGMGYYNGQYNKYFDGGYPYNRCGGMGFYIEVDVNGNHKIERVDFSRSGNTSAHVTVKETGIKINETYKPDVWGIDKSYAWALLENCKLTGENHAYIHADPWILPHPESDNSHLTCYSDDRGKVPAPEFSEDAKVFARINENGKVEVTFPAATSKGFILQYVVSVINEAGETVVCRKALGNYCDSVSGVKVGTSHLDATEFQYEFPDEIDAAGCSVEVFAYDEYKNKSDVLVFGKL